MAEHMLAQNGNQVGPRDLNSRLAELRISLPEPPTRLGAYVEASNAVFTFPERHASRDEPEAGYFQTATIFRSRMARKPPISDWNDNGQLHAIPSTSQPRPKSNSGTSSKTIWKK